MRTSLRTVDSVSRRGGLLGLGYVGSRGLVLAVRFKAALEIKRYAKARVSPAQRRFIEAVRLAGGVIGSSKGGTSSSQPLPRHLQKLCQPS
jgi:hypothetical protein